MNSNKEDDSKKASTDIDSLSKPKNEKVKPNNGKLCEQVGFISILFCTLTLFKRTILE